MYFRRFPFYTLLGLPLFPGRPALPQVSGAAADPAASAGASVDGAKESLLSGEMPAVRPARAHDLVEPAAQVGGR